MFARLNMQKHAYQDYAKAAELEDTPATQVTNTLATAAPSVVLCLLRL